MVHTKVVNSYKGHYTKSRTGHSLSLIGASLSELHGSKDKRKFGVFLVRTADPTKYACAQTGTRVLQTTHA